MPSNALLRVENAQRLRTVARDLRQFDDGKVLRRKLRKELKATFDPLAKAEKRAVLALPSKGQNARRGRPSLRRNIARATQTRIRMAGPRVGAMVWVNPRRMPAGQANLPAYMEGLRPFHRWRHPTFGNWDKAVQQRSRPWFYKTAYRHERAAERAASRVIDQLANEIESRL